MSREIPPPFCFICHKDFEGKEYLLHYCICDTAVCTDCLNSVKKSENVWICPKCTAENDIKDTKLIRSP